MTYFEFHISPSSEASSDIILIDNFHPMWKEAAKSLMSAPNFTKIMENYASIISNWSRIPLGLRFLEFGLHHITTQPRASLDLWSNDEKYRSHNIHSVEEVGVVVAVMSNYISHLNYAIKRLEGKL